MHSRTQFFALSPAPSAILDAEGNLQDVNAAWVAYLGGLRSSQRVLHETILHPDDRRRIRALLETPRFSYVARYRHANGSWKGLEIEGARQLGRDCLLVGRIVASPAGIPMTEAIFQRVLDTISEFVLVKGPGSRILWANQAFREFYGMTNEELADRLDTPFSQPDHTMKFLRDDARVFESGKPLVIEEEPVLRADGQQRFFSTVKTPLLDESGRVFMSVGISRDISDLKQASELVDEQRQKMLATAKMSALGEMASGVAHEINNPLAVISLRAAQLRELASQPNFNPEMAARSAEKIESVTLRIAKIIRGLRAFARDAEGDPAQPVLLTAIVDDTLEICNERLRCQGIAFTLDNQLQDEPLRLECRSVQIVQVLLNLLNNAIDAVADLPEPWIKLTLRRRDRWAEITLCDCGPGIGPPIAERIFESFFTTKEAGKGTGLGLSVSKGIIEAHGGTLTLTTPASNTTFRVCLPRYSGP